MRSRDRVVAGHRAGEEPAQAVRVARRRILGGSAGWMLAAFADSSGLAAENRNLEPVPAEAVKPYTYSHALLIGASRYWHAQWRRLPGVERDIDEVAKVFTFHGFTISRLMNPTHVQLHEALRRFATDQGRRPDSRLVVYWAGHGHTLITGNKTKLGYLVPVDAPSPGVNNAGFREKAYSMESMQQLSREIEARHVLFLFDSCFSGTIFLSRSGDMETVDANAASPVRQFISSGDESQRVPDDSIFRRQLVTALSSQQADTNGDGLITGTELGAFLGRTVSQMSDGLQTPVWGKIRDPNLQVGEFLFATVPPSLTDIAAGARRPANPIVEMRPVDAKANLPDPEWGGKLKPGIDDLLPLTKRGSP